MNYFDKANEVLAPYIEYDDYVVYSIDKKNKTAGLELYFSDTDESEAAELLIHKALRTVFAELGLNKIYMNVIRDNYPLYKILDRFNFISEAIHRCQYYNGHKYHDVVYMTVTKDEWELGGIKYGFQYENYSVKEEFFA